MSSRITLIFSLHKEIRKCNSNALVEIIKSISPDVIFEELSEEQYTEAYIDDTLHNLESLAIRKYVKTHPVPHVPVDTFERPVNYRINQDRLIQTLTNSMGVHSFHYCNLLDQKQSYLAHYGFQFLNSTYNQKLFEELEELEEKILSQKNKEALWELSANVKENLAKREDAMLDNVYAYARDKDFRQGLMLIGSGHQKSILQKIILREEKEDVKIEWSFLPEPEFISQTSQ